MASAEGYWLLEKKKCPICPFRELAEGGGGLAYLDVKLVTHNFSLKVSLSKIKKLKDDLQLG